MYVEYFYWQYINAPRWLVVLSGNVQRALWRFFSVPFMVRTLLAHWHRDVVSYRVGSMSGILLAIAWNVIARGIGFGIRSVVLVAWLASALIFLALAVVTIGLFLLWPLVIVLTFAVGAALVSGAAG